MNRPKMLDKPAPMYETAYSKYPDRVRISFEDGTTAVYELRYDQPHPIIMENVKIIRKWRGYVNQPARRKRK